MFNYLIKIEYEGTNFVGWQSQKNEKSIQDCIEKALKKVLGTNIKIIGAGSSILTILRANEALISKKITYDLIDLRNISQIDLNTIINSCKKTKRLLVVEDGWSNYGFSSEIISKGFEPFLCQTEEEARLKSQNLIEKKKWPCYFFKSDTSGEKAFEEFYTNKESVFLDKFIDIGIVKNEINCDIMILNKFYKKINDMRNNLNWNKEQIIKEMKNLIPEFSHHERKKNLDEKMD